MNCHLSLTVIVYFAHLAILMHRVAIILTSIFISFVEGFLYLLFSIDKSSLYLYSMLSSLSPFKCLPCSFFFLWLSVRCTPPPLYCRTVTRKSCSQTPLKSASGWPKRCTVARGPRNENSDSYCWAPDHLNHFVIDMSHSYFVINMCGYGRKYIFTYLLTYLQQRYWLLKPTITYHEDQKMYKM